MHQPNVVLRHVIAGLAVLTLLNGGCATSGSGPSMDPKVCAAIGGLLAGGLGGHIGATTSSDQDVIPTAAGAAGGAALGAAVGWQICANQRNTPPSVRASATPTRGEAPLQVTLRAVGHDEDGEISSYSWNLGDGASASGAEVQHTYESVGVRTARVTVTDDRGASAATEVQIEVAQAHRQANTPSPVAKRIVLRGVNFSFDSATLGDEATVVLMSAIETLKENPDVRIRISGHTDNTGSEEYNQNLSEHRAKAVLDYLVSQGLSPTRLSAVGFGESKPVADNMTRDGRAQNRRVELETMR